MCLAVPGRVEERVTDESGLPFARVRFGSVSRRVCLSYTPEVVVGDYVIVHVGFAIQQLDEVQALATLEELDRAFAAGEEDT